MAFGCRGVPAPDLQTAAEHNDVEAMKSLISKGAAIGVPDKLGYTPLHAASISGSDNAAEYLIANGASVDAPDGLGHSPLWAAAINGNESTVQLLLKHGAKPRPVSNAGVTLIQEMDNLQQVGRGKPSYTAIKSMLESAPK